MESIWTKINDAAGVYFTDIVEQYKMKFVKTDSLSSALIGEKFAILISIDRFTADVSYVFRNEKNQLTNLLCDSFFTMKYDDEDRVNLLPENKAGNAVKNDLSILSRGLKSKWSDVLLGSRAWLDDYKASKWYAEGRLRPMEEELLSRYIE